MTKIHFIYNRLLHTLLMAFVVCGIGTSCADDYFADNGNSGKMTNLSVQLPKAVSGDSQVTSAYFIAFQAGGAGTSGTLQVNTKITSSTGHLLVPVGNSNIYIIANAPDSLRLENVHDEEGLIAKTVTWALSKSEPHIMVGSYRNVFIDSGGVKDSDGNSVTLGQNLKRLASKLTVNLQYESLGGKDILIDSVTIGNRAAHSFLLPCAFEANSYVSEAVDRVAGLTEVSTTGGITTYQPLVFYLSEYLVNADHASSSTRMYIHAHTQGETDNSVYTVYIGDWFGGSITYDDFKDAGTPAELVGVEGLSVTRNKHYTLNCKLKGAAQSGIQLHTDVKEWTVVNINGNVTMPYFNISSTDVMINPLKAQGTPINYEASVPSDSISVDITDNPDNRFSYTISDQHINFIHSRLDVDRLTNDVGLPITGKAVVTVKDGNARISKNITLGVFNPISRFYVRGMDADYNYAVATPGGIANTWVLNWAAAAGYNNPYAGITTSLHGQNPSSSLMGNAVADSYSGCSGYWEGSTTDRKTGRGVWRLPVGGDGNSEAARLMTLLQHLDISVLGFDMTDGSTGIWSATEDGASAAKAMHPDGTSVSKNKLFAHYVRCVRELDNTASTGASSYLNVSHTVYETAPLTYRQMRGTAPIYYESDGPVTIKLLDENGNDISNQGIGMPFIGFTADTEGLLYDTAEPSIVFPNSSYVGKKKGYFCLHFTLYEGEFQETTTSLGDLKGPMPSTLRGRKYTLQFTSGSLIKNVQIQIVNTMAKADAGTMTFVQAMGLSDLYAGYDYFLNKRISSGTDPRVIHLSQPVPDTVTGCAGYWEGSRTDPKTGIGNWFISEAIVHLSVIYSQNYARWRPYLGSLNDVNNFNIIYGDGGNFSFSNGYYWSNVVAGNYSPEKHAQLVVFQGAVQYVDKRLNSTALLRCERRLNADLLSLSTQNVELTPGTSQDVIFYTDAISIADIKSEDILHISGTNPAFTATTTTTTSAGRITVNCLNTAVAGSEANLLVRTVGKSKRAETYKIIKLKVK